jgi:hypothetical protein
MIRLMLFLAVAYAAEWSQPAEVRHDENLCLAYRARVDGPYVVVRAKIEPGWHTFSMDNRVRAEEKLAGKKSLGIDHPTEIAVTGGLTAVAPWFQTPPKDFSKPELRWFSWGFEREAVFVARVKRGAGPAKIGIKGQACTETTCKNIDVSLTVAGGGSGTAEVNLKDLVQVR